MKRFLVALAAVGCLIDVAPLSAQEAISLTTPIAKPSIAGYTPVSLQIVVSPPQIIVRIAASDSTLETFEYPCATPCANDTQAKVATLINALNTANLTTRSLWRRVFDRLLLDFPLRFPGGATAQ